MSVPIHPLSYQNQMNDDQDDAEAEARPMVPSVVDPSFKSAHLPFPSEFCCCVFFL